MIKGMTHTPYNVTIIMKGLKSLKAFFLCVICIEHMSELEILFQNADWGVWAAGVRTSRKHTEKGVVKFRICA